MILSWQQFYEMNKNIGNVNEIAAQYNMYVFQNEEQYRSEFIRGSGGDRYILLEDGSILLQEGLNEYALLQE